MTFSAQAPCRLLTLIIWRTPPLPPGSTLLQATSHTSAPGPVSGSNTTDPSTVEIRTQPLSGGGDSYTFDPLPQRPKRFRAQATPSETGGTPAQPKPRAGDGEGGPTLVISATTSSQCMVVPQENGSVSPRDSNVSLSMRVRVVGVGDGAVFREL